MRARVRKRNYRAATRLHALWWLCPPIIVLLLGVPLLIVAYLIPEEAYLVLYGSKKHVDLDFVLAGLVIYGALLAGSLFPIGKSTRPQLRTTLLYCRWVVWPLFALVMVGYLVWFASATLRAGGPGTLLSMFFGLLIQPEAGMTDYVKFELFKTIPGVTTMTQFGILYATVEALLWRFGGSQRRVALLRIVCIATPTLLRTVLLSERLALLEVGIPVAVVLLATTRPTRKLRVLTSFAPLLAGFAVVILFAVAEYFRSWTYYRSSYTGSYPEFALERFFGYYATALNNAAVYYHYGQVEPLKNTLNSLLEFPVLGSAAKIAYQAFFDVQPIEHDYMLRAYANPEFNNVALVGSLLNDLPIFPASIVAFLIGVVSFSLYRSFTGGRLIGLLLYPSWFIGLLEISRIYYWPGGRYFPTFAFLFFSLLLFGAIKARSSRSSRYRRRPGNVTGRAEDTCYRRNGKVRA